MRIFASNKPSLLAGASTTHSSPAEVQPRNRGRSWAVCLFLALAVWAVFGQTLHHDFVNYDDRFYIYENPAITRGLSLNGVVWAFTHVGDHEWFPLTWISRMLDLQLYGLKAGGHHLTNVLLHAATAILLFLVLRKMTRALWPAAFVAAVFAIHPLRVESVAWVTERKDVLSGLFFMLTLWAYVRYGQESRVWSLKSRVWYGLALAFFALGLLAKTMLVTLPFVLLLLDYWPLSRPQLKIQDSRPKTILPLLLEKVPFLALAIAGCVATILTQPNTVGFVHGLSVPWRIGNALMAYADYLWHMVYPVGLAVGYPPAPMQLPVWRVGVSLLVLALISVGVVAGRRKHPYLLVGWLWYLGMLVPVIDIMQAGINARADRFTYLPQIGLYVLVAWGAADFCRGWRHRRAGLGGAAVVILAALLAAAHVQTGYWKDSLSLWTRAIACTPGNQIAHNNLGILLAGQGKLDEAIQHFERAIQIKPDYAKACFNLGNALARQGKLPEAIQHFERALQLNPGYVQAHCSLASALTSQGRLNEAVQHLQQALSLAQAQNNPALAEAIRNQLKMYQPVSPQPQTP